MATGDSSFKNDLKKDGYSKEEKYFHDINRELVNARLERLRASDLEALRTPPTSPHDSSDDPSHDSSDTPSRRHGLSHWLRRVFGVREGTSNLF